jgi:adenine-specific DNA-methyltransferase
MIKYLGSKRLLIPLILQVVRSFPHVRTVIDLFSGTSRVGHALKAVGYRVFANDYTAYAHALATCYVQADREDVETRATDLIREMRRLPPKAGYFTQTYCEKSRFFHPKNGARIDAMREWIAGQDLGAELEAVLLVSLMEAADRVDSTTGVQMAYLKDWAPRAHNAIHPRVPVLLPRSKWGKGAAYRMDARDAIDMLSADVTYIDPPYNQHSFLSNYHIWESLVLWDKPGVYGVACKRVDCKTRKSVFNSRYKSNKSVKEIINKCNSDIIIVSFSDEGYVSREWMEEVLRKRGEVITIRVGYNRYVGARIGIYNPEGVKVGRISHLRNHEYIYVVCPPELRGCVQTLRDSHREQEVLFPVTRNETECGAGASV